MAVWAATTKLCKTCTHTHTPIYFETHQSCVHSEVHACCVWIHNFRTPAGWWCKPAGLSELSSSAWWPSQLRKSEIALYPHPTTTPSQIDGVTKWTILIASLAFALLKGAWHVVMPLALMICTVLCPGEASSPGPLGKQRCTCPVHHKVKRGRQRVEPLVVLCAYDL